VRFGSERAGPRWPAGGLVSALLDALLGRLLTRSGARRLPVLWGVLASPGL